MRLLKRLPTVAVAAFLAMLIFGTREAPATVAEQRARLPPAAECESPVAGKWKALAYAPRTRSWYEFTLEVHEDEKDKTQLSGMIYVEAWEGPENTPEPPVPCVDRFRGKMPGSGSFINGQVAFSGGQFTMIETVCGGIGRYNPDNFTGKLEPELHEFQAVNNDGGMAVNDPTVFRRIKCFDAERKDPGKEGKEIAPPPFFPKQQKSGC
jgi:hypothetical protein